MGSMDARKGARSSVTRAPAARACEVDAIYTFYDGPQARRTLHVACATPRGISEASLIRAAFAALDDAHLAKLLKISVAIMGATSMTELPAFVRRNGGKFYFNVETNHGPDVAANLVRKATELITRWRRHGDAKNRR